MSKAVKDYFRTILISVAPIGFVLQSIERKQEMLKVANFLLLAEPITLIYQTGSRSSAISPE